MRDAEGNHWSVVAASDDNGRSWTLGDPVGPDCDENKVVEITTAAESEAEVLLHARATPLRRQAVSSDGGASFTRPEPHPCPVGARVQRWTGQVGNLLVCSLLDDPEERRNLGLRFSTDSGATWSDPVAIDTGASAYSVVAELADGALGVLWEAGDYSELRFARITQELDAHRLHTPDQIPLFEPLTSPGGSAKPPEVAPARNH